MPNGEYKGAALITGASSGVGAVYADRFARRGYDLILVARNEDRLRSFATRLSDATGRSVETIAADLIKPADLARVETTLRTDASVTTLINTAEVAETGPLLAATVEEMSDIIALNVRALTRLVYTAAPGFVARGAGTIINIASSAALTSETLNGVYGASKAFVLALSRSLQHELASNGVRIQAVLPGATATGTRRTGGSGLSNVAVDFLMGVDDMVDAALAGLDQGEHVTIPSLPEMADWDQYEAARLVLIPNLSRSQPAARYGVASRNAA